MLSGDKNSIPGFIIYRRSVTVFCLYFFNEESRQIVRVWENKEYNDTSELLGYEWNSVLVCDYVEPSEMISCGQELITQEM